MVDGSPRQSQEWGLLVKAAWRVVGAVESPRSRPDLELLVDGVLDRVSQQEPVSMAVRCQVRDTLYGWFQVRDGRPALAQDARGEVDEMLLPGIAQQMMKRKPPQTNETLFWAIGTLHVEAAAETVLASWSPNQIDSLLDYSICVLRQLSEQESVINPERMLGHTVERGRVSIDPAYRTDRVAILRRTDFGRPDLYSGVANVIRLVMRLRPGRFPELVEKVDHPMIQRWALLVVARRPDADRWQALDWLKENQSEAVTAVAMVHALEVMRELAGVASHPGIDQREREEASTAVAELLPALIDRLAQYEPADSVRWIAELYEHGDLPRVVVVEAGSYDLGELLEDYCLDKLEALLRQTWDGKLRESLRSCGRQGAAQRTLPLGIVANRLSPDNPERAAELARIVLEKHEEHTNEIVRSNDRAFYTLTDRRTIKWMRGLGAALALALPDDETLVDWAFAQCSRLELTVWDAEENPERFSVEDDVAQMQITVALYAVVAMYEAGIAIEAEMVRKLAEMAWYHSRFVGEQEGYRQDEPEVDELAARVVVELGSPSEEWLILRAKSLEIGPRGLWAMVDAYVKKFDYPTLLNELSDSISTNYHSIKSAEINTLRYLAKIWQVLQLSDPALETAETMLEYHQRAMQREDYCEVMNLLVLASRKRGPASKTRWDMLSLYEHLWGNHVPREEVDLKQIVDAFLA